MFISSLILSIAYGADCPEGESDCTEADAPPLVILEPTPSPGASSPEASAAEEPPLVILAPVPSPGSDEDAEPEAVSDDEDEEDVVYVTDRRDKHDKRDNTHGPRLIGQYAMQFLGGGPTHQLQARRYGRKDAYLGAELRYLPRSESVVWAGRIGAGFDLFGPSRFDLQLGLFLGSAGEWDVLDDNAIGLYHSPIVGTEVRIGYDGRQWFTAYRWVGGGGPGPVRGLLTEREFTLGYKITPVAQILVQSVRIDPRSGRDQWSLGLGGRLSF